MKRAMGLSVLFCLCMGIVMISADADSETENDLMQMASSPLGNPSHLENENTSYLKRFWLSVFPPYKESHPPMTHMPLIIWRFRFFLVRNNSNELLASATEGATTDNGDQDVVQKIEPTSSSLVSTEKNSKSSRRKRNKRNGQLALHSYMNIDDLENYITEGKNLHKKLKSKIGKKFISIHDISPNFNKSSNSTLKHCYRRLYTYVSADWSLLFVHILVVLFFILVLTVVLVICQSIIQSIQGKRVKIGKPKAIQYYSMC